MANQHEYISVEKQSLTPDKLVLYRSTIKREIQNYTTWQRDLNQPDICEEIKKSDPRKMPERRFHNFEISETAQRNIKQKITWMYHLAKSRYVVSKSGKEITNYKMAFITLTLPSTQAHNTAFITENCLNQFLTELRQNHGLQNYVWRLEFQKNGNVHYHIVTDTFIDWETIRLIWNRVLNKHGYIKPYTDKMFGMSLNDYVNNYNKNGAVAFDVLAKRYAHGRATNWTNPPSVDVISCTSNKAISNYIAKYFNKKEKSGVQKNFLDTEENSNGLRLWFCSRGLSRLKSIKDFVEVAPIQFEMIVANIENAVTRIYDYCKIVYFNCSKASVYYKSILFPIFRNYADSVGYSSA